MLIASAGVVPMLPRVLEPEVMDSAADAHDYDAMDHSGVNRLFASDFLTRWTGRNPVLDVGTGTALIPIELCRQNPNIAIIAIDLAEYMLALARTNVERAGFASRIGLEKTDAKGLRFADGHFAAVVSNSIIHHIPEPSTCFAEMHRVCAVGGGLFVRDLLRPDSLSARDALVARYAANDNPHQRQLFADSLHAALTLEEVRAIVGAFGYAATSVTQTSDRHWTFAVIRC